MSSDAAKSSSSTPYGSDSHKPSNTQNQPPTDDFNQTTEQISQPADADSDNRVLESESTYAPSMTSTKTSSSSFQFGSLSKLPLLSRSRSSSAGSSTSSDTTLRTQSSKSRTDGKHGLLGAIFRKSKAGESGKGKSRSQTPSDQEGETEPTDEQKPKVRDPVKTVPSGKPPAVTFGDLAYRYGTPGGSGSRGF